MAQHSADQGVHEAARAGLTDKLAEMLAKGMDARTPLHCAGTVAVAALLLDHGARIDACDEDAIRRRRSGESASRRTWRDSCWTSGAWGHDLPVDAGL